MSTLKDLVGKSLAGFQIIEMTEVYKENEDGRKIRSVGFFKDENIAVVFAGSQVDSEWYRTGKVLALTDGKVGYIVREQQPVNFFDEQVEALKLKEGIIAKLSKAERTLLGFES